MKESLLIGTYSQNGIYKFSLNNTNLTQVKFENSYENCSYLSKSDNTIYTVTEYSNKSPFLNGCLISRNYNLDIKNITSITGKSPCHITLDNLRNILYISNYEDGSLNIFSLNKTGTINKLIYYKKYSSVSHIHCTALYENNNILFVVDLGSNKLFSYKINYTSNFELKELHCYNFTDGTQPRHLVISENNIYVITENSCELYHFTFSEKNGFKLIKNVSIIPSEILKKENYTGCAIRISLDGNFIYTTIRGHNSISVFNASLELVQSIPCFGLTPRDINFNSSQNLMFCANQNSSNITIFTRNKNTGHLLFKSKYPVKNPACIIFL